LNYDPCIPSRTLKPPEEDLGSAQTDPRIERITGCTLRRFVDHQCLRERLVGPFQLRVQRTPHRLAEELPGPFDFVFLDADKEYYLNYARALVPKIEPGGCLTAHNVDDPGPVRQGGYYGSTAEYYRYMRSLAGFETRIHPQSRYGIAVSYKKK